MAVIAAIVGAPQEQGGLLPTLGSATSRGTEVLGRSRTTSLTDRLHALWRSLLPQELWERALSVDRVIIVPDGPLHAVPFDALVVETAETGEQTRFWLDVGPVVQYSPSASVLFSLAGQPDARALGGASGILSLSDPVYDPAEVAELMAAGKLQQEEPEVVSGIGRETQTRNAFERAGGSLARLPGTAVETGAIRDAIGEAALGRFVALQRLDATEPALRSAIEGKAFLHLATHGLVDQRAGSLFAGLALTPPATETADPNDDGFLQLYEIYDLPLTDVELVVLSACESHVGVTVGSEGVFALSRGFLARGARRVVASQWAVDDASTAALVGDFFGAVVADGLVDYAMALRNAKRAVRAQAGWADPYHWAPFVLTGVS